MSPKQSCIVSRWCAAIPPLALLGAATWLGFLACLPAVWGSSEAREAHVVALMQSSGEYILPLRNGIVPSKPPLFHWLASVLLEGLPVAPITAARWVSVLAATVVLVQLCRLAGRFARIFAPHDTELHSMLSWLAPALMLTSYGFVTMATDARVDMCFAALVVSAVTALIGSVSVDELRFGVAPSEENRRFSWFFALCGLATVAKGPLGMVLPIIVGSSW
ncbi:MAG: hypothetical protein EBZ48_03800, partial [Proteobacteria bacterium]|nr:hypothetical protein [Pseudomonadota bacterium]